MVGVSLDAWDSWGRLQQTNRISAIADASANLFKAMHNLRTDRSTTIRLLNSDQPVGSEIDKYLRGIRDAEMPAMATALGAARHRSNSPSRQTLVPELDRLFKTLTALQKEFWDAMRQAEGLAPRGAGEGLHGDAPRRCLRPSTNFRRARRRRQPSGSRRSISC